MTWNIGSLALQLRRGFTLRFGLIGLLMLAVWLPSQARASNEPIFAAVPEWVEQPPVPAPVAEHSGRPIQTLIISYQTSHSANASTRYLETVTKIQTAEGLAAAGNLAIPWQPEQQDLVIHKLEVIRDGVTHNVLAGQKFSVLRRESNLEAALIDGTLTATIQPDDLRVGDILRVAYSLRANSGTIGFKPEDRLVLQPKTMGTLVLIREIWPDSVPMRWTASPGMGTLKVSKTKYGNELRAQFRNLEVAPPPPAAPPRFAATMALQTSAYRDWAEVSALLAPPYAKAVTLSDVSPLKAEARLIRTAQPTPKARALAALRLVQDKIRYLALLMNEGGVTPASADETWQRRFGDCKGKSAILVALLRELGIEAEPMLVDTFTGDGLPTLLPDPVSFNHVIVHATIDGKSYWLDGTRAGDRDLEELTSSGFGYGLPVRASGATLIQLRLAPPSEPLNELKLIWDATAGPWVPASARGEVIFHGADAAALKAALAQVGETELKKSFDDPLYFSGADDRVLRFNAGPDNGPFSVLFSGKGRLDWNRKGDPPNSRFQLSNRAIEWRPKFPEREGSNAQIPVRIEFPRHFTMREEVILPDQGIGYSLAGKSFDRTVAGTRISRTLTLENGRAVAVSTLIGLKPEISAAEAKASPPTLAEIAEDAAYVIAPTGLYGDEWDLSREPKTAEDFISRGYTTFDGEAGKYSSTDFDRSLDLTRIALADFDKAITLSSDPSRGYIFRALALQKLGRLDEADATISKAFALKTVSLRAYQVRGLINARRNRPQAAILDLSRYIDGYNPNSVLTLFERGQAYEKTGQLEKARADLQRAVSLNGGGIAATSLARVLVRLGKAADAIAVVDSVIKNREYNSDVRSQHPEVLDLHRGDLLAMAGLKERARASYEAGLRNVDAGLKQLPPSSGTELNDDAASRVSSKVSLLVAAGRVPEAIAVADEVLKSVPDNIRILASRCNALLHTSGPGRMAAARQDCDAARSRAPLLAEAHFYSGLVSLKARDWLRAKGEFDAATRMRSPQPGALFGRGIAKLRLRETESGWADIGLARIISPEVDFDFVGLGITPETDKIAAGAPQADLTLYRGAKPGEPATPEEFLARGYERYEKWQMRDALADFDRVVALAPDSSIAQSLRGLALIRLGRLDEANAAIAKAMASSPVDPRTFQVRGLLNARRGHPEKAIPDLSRNLEPGAVSAVWLRERALAYEQTGQLELARADLQKVIDLAPSLPVRQSLARVTARLGNMAGAISLVDATVTGLDANLAPWLRTYALAMHRGRVLGMAGRLEAARSGYDKALQEIDASLSQLPAQGGGAFASIDIRQAKAELLIRMGRPLEAADVTDRALAISPANSALLVVRCKAHLSIAGQLANARQDCDAALQTAPANVEALYTSAKISLKANDWARAEREFDALAKATSGAPGPIYGRGIAKLRQGKKADGTVDIEFARSQSVEVDAEFNEVGIEP